MFLGLGARLLVLQNDVFDPSSAVLHIPFRLWAAPPLTPPPPKGPLWEKTEFTVGEILLGHFWYTLFLGPIPPPSAPSNTICL